MHELPRLQEQLHRFDQLDERVKGLSEQVEREVSSREDPQEQAAVEKEDYRVEDEAGNVENEALVNPLFAVVQLNRIQLVLEVVLDALKREPNELHVSKQTLTYLETDDHIDLAHTLFRPLAVGIQILFVRKLIVEGVRDDKTDEDHGA